MLAVKKNLHCPRTKVFFGPKGLFTCCKFYNNYCIPGSLNMMETLSSNDSYSSTEVKEL